MTIRKSKIVGLTLHHTAGSTTDTVESIRKIHKAKGWGDIGYNFVLEIKNGKGYLKSGRDTKYIGAHAGVEYYNKYYLSIVIPGNYSKYTLPSEIYNDLINAICHIMKKYDLKKLNGHREIKATECPGSKINMDKIREDVSRKLGFTVEK